MQSWKGKTGNFHAIWETAKTVLRQPFQLKFIDHKLVQLKDTINKGRISVYQKFRPTSVGNSPTALIVRTIALLMQNCVKWKKVANPK